MYVILLTLPTLSTLARQLSFLRRRGAFRARTCARTRRRQPFHDGDSRVVPNAFNFGGCGRRECVRHLSRPRRLSIGQLRRSFLKKTIAVNRNDVVILVMMQESTFTRLPGKVGSSVRSGIATGVSFGCEPSLDQKGKCRKSSSNTFGANLPGRSLDPSAMLLQLTHESGR